MGAPKSPPGIWPEKNANCISKLYFCYFWSLILKGYQKTLTLSDLWTIDNNEKSENVHGKFLKEYENVKKNHKARNGYTLLLAALKTHKRNFSWAVILTLVETLWSLVLILNVKWLMRYAVHRQEPFWHALGYVFLLFVTQIIGNMCFRHKDHILAKVGIRLKSALALCVYNKTLRLSPAARQAISAGEITNLISGDAGQFIENSRWIHYLWSAPVLLIIGCYILYTTVGHACWVGILPFLVGACVNCICGKYYQNLHKQQMRQKDERLRLFGEILRIIATIKLFAWELAFQKFLNRIRNEEMDFTKKIYMVQCVNGVISFCTNLFACLVTFSTYTLALGHELTYEKAFVVVIINYFYLYRLLLLDRCIFSTTAVLASFVRIERFLNAPERKPYVLKRPFDPHLNMAIRIRSGCFSWDGSKGANILHDINIELRAQELIAIVGQVGSGKSSLLSAIAGETCLISGSVETFGSLAYVSQQSWLLNDTIKGNILFNKPFDEGRYRRTIFACALEPDLAGFPAGDMTEIGERGVNLSGGQKQRIILARAVYQNCDIYLLDDPLSSVDVNVKHHLFENVIGNTGILKDKTRVFVTNSLSYLTHCDRVLTLDHGRIVMSKRGEQTSDMETLIHSHGGQWGDTQQEDSTMEEQQRKDLKKIQAGKIIEEETISIGNVSWFTYWFYFKAAGLPFFIASLAIILACAMKTIAMIFLRVWTDPRLSDIWHITTVFGISVFGLLVELQVIFGLIQGISLISFAQRGATSLYDQLLAKILRAPISFFICTPVGRILNRFAQDISTVDNTIPISIMTSVRCMATTALATVPSIYAAPITLIVLVPSLLVCLIFRKLYLRSSSQFQRLEAKSQSPIYSRLHDALDGAEHIRIYEQESHFLWAIQGALDTNASTVICKLTGIRWQSVYLELTAAINISAVALFAILQENVSPALLGLSLSTILVITHILVPAVQETCITETAMVAVERIYNYLQIESEADWVKADQKAPGSDDRKKSTICGMIQKALNRIFPRTGYDESSSLHIRSAEGYSGMYGSCDQSHTWAAKIPSSSKWLTSGKVEFVDYCLKYRQDLPLALKHISLTIEPGRKIGVIGRTGAGKTSLITGLFRLVEPSSGKILIDSVDISTLGLHELRRNLAIIPQDPALFMGTIRQNLDPLGDYSDEQIWRALDVSSMKDYVENTSLKLSHKLDDQGSNLSVGQRQLLCLARALLKRSKILVMDEATAFVDQNTDQVIQRAVRTYFRDCTVITIAHRLETVMDYDSIALLDDGRLIEYGQARKLLADPNSTLYRLAMQAELV